MAFHVACPITCRRICFCKIGFPQKLQSEKGREEFLGEVIRVEELLSDPRLVRGKEGRTVQVEVPRVSVTQGLDGFGGGDGYGGGGGGTDGEELLSAQKKRAAMQRRAVAASLAAEDYARRFETGVLEDAPRDTVQDLVGEDQGSSAVNVMCRLCFYGENEGTERARRMLACKICSKKYHRNCLKNWAQHRDLFHWSSWACPSCRICEVCRRTGDPNKFMFCKRCDGAYHCYCQQPPHKNVSSGPYLCPKHTKCHSCASTVPGNGLSTRWFLGYTFCDACGRLFVKGKYCPVCLKVYRDSESTPMVCCDACQRWVHCQCDGISDEKYLQFQADNNLYYKCAACRGDCYQVKDIDDAVRELWRRRDDADYHQIASLRAAAGLPTQEEIFSIAPYSDDEENGPVVLKNDYGRTLKFSLKGFVDKSPKSSKEYGKKSNKEYIKKKEIQASLTGKTEAHKSFESQHDVRSFECSLGDEANDDLQSHRTEGQEVFSSSVAGSPVNTKGIFPINQPGILKHKFIDEIGVSNEDRASRVDSIKSDKSHVMDIGDGTAKHANKSETVKGTKLVIHLGARNRNITNSPRSEASSCHREQDLTASIGSDDTCQQKASNKKHICEEQHDGMSDAKTVGEKLETTSQSGSSKLRVREGNLIKLGRGNSEVPELKLKIVKGNMIAGSESTAIEKTRVFSRKRSAERSSAVADPVTEATTSSDYDVLLRKNPKGTSNARVESYDTKNPATVSDLLPKDPKPLLKLKFKNPYLEDRSSWVPHGEEDKSSVKGQRSKRRRPSPSVREDEDEPQLHRDNPINEVMDANWILEKLGKDAIGKRVEVHQPSDNSWHKAVVIDVIEGTSTLFVRFDDGRHKTLELEKQGVRFVPQKQKRSKT